MITNSKLTIYHKTFNQQTRLEEWTRYNFDNVWAFKTNSASINEDINESNNLEVRIPYVEYNNEVISLGDIVVCDEINEDITKQQDLNCETFNIRNINDNFYGNNPHIHLGCK